MQNIIIFYELKGVYGFLSKFKTKKISMKFIKIITCGMDAVEHNLN